ncbi:MAG: hypothetical protein WDM71_10360 [Ferruginibacter sp.]
MRNILKKSKQYEKFICKRQTKTVKLFLRYTIAFSSNANEKKVARLYNKLLNEVQQSKTQLDSLPAFKGNRMYKDAAIYFMNVYQSMLNNDYKNIDGIKKKSLQSFNAINGFTVAKESFYKKLSDANEQLHTASIKFDSAFINKKDKLSATMKQVDNVNVYYDSVYLIFLKNYIQETTILNAIKKKDEKSLPQNADSLSSYAQNGLSALDTIKPFKHDHSLIKTCKHSLKLYKNEADKKINIVADYFSKADDFKKIRTEFEHKKTHNIKEFKAYTKSVKEFNIAISHYNKTMHYISKTRKKIERQWNFTTDNFFDKHFPVWKISFL